MAFDFIQHSIEQRRTKSLLRRRICIQSSDARYINVDSKRYLNFASNDYLGLGGPVLANDVLSGSRSSSLVTGYLDVHKKLEHALCQLLGYDDAMLFSSGFSANSSVLKALFNEQSVAKDSAIFQDKLNHASLIDGASHSDARHIRFNHNDMNHLRARLEKSNALNKLIVSEGVFSMDGDSAPLAQLHALKQQHNAWLMIDDAHAFGITGKQGLGSAQTQNKPDILVITFGKAMACQGAAVLASHDVIDYLVQVNRDYIYSTAMSPVMAHSALQQLDKVINADDARTQLQQNIALFQQLCANVNIPLLTSNTPIQPIVLGSAENALNAQRKLKQHNIWLTAIRPPTVPHNTARLRVTLTAAHKSDDIHYLVQVLGEVL
ncbi:8-amino-7-oxononanoate synthase [Pseudoalteromonas sp. MMG013]|uniref:aminotransferase class I/II-fold pyridoxal phosphate-dependent enzyme n=1 Tax=Pseudoalteromonas sp. MMG013 TaxID=2822687 RepID=UPI001B35FE08|nr:8-amino-7-oxononanoate synthase [Pseudoalteromonas sp. MMG013]MBQ4863614.1 8-amino-7-oxononanoate synthase [Pseudoalteromonas sp. MMG013]